MEDEYAVTAGIHASRLPRATLLHFLLVFYFSAAGTLIAVTHSRTGFTGQKRHSDVRMGVRQYLEALIPSPWGCLSGATKRTLQRTKYWLIDALKACILNG